MSAPRSSVLIELPEGLSPFGIEHVKAGLLLELNQKASLFGGSSLSLEDITIIIADIQRPKGYSRFLPDSKHPEYVSEMGKTIIAALSRAGILLESKDNSVCQELVSGVGQEE